MFPIYHELESPCIKSSLSAEFSEVVISFLILTDPKGDVGRKSEKLLANVPFRARWFPYFYSNKSNTCAKMKTSPVIVWLWHGYALIVLL